MRSLLLSVSLALCAVPAAAQMEMSADEREAFRAEVRAYLLDNPEVLMEAIGILEQRERDAQAAAQEQALSSLDDDIFNDGYSYVGGNPDGDITMVEFLDYRCGYCKRAHPEVERLLAEDGNIRFIVKEFPILGEQSVLASRFAIATKLVAGDEAYKDLHDALMEFRGDVTEASLARLADGLALDSGAILARIDDPEITEIIQRNRALGDALQINGTPSFVVETEILRGYLPYDQMDALVNALRG